jgi:hypothetical protein
VNVRVLGALHEHLGLVEIALLDGAARLAEHQVDVVALEGLARSGLRRRRTGRHRFGARCGSAAARCG